jgi:hypothetical protein
VGLALLREAPGGGVKVLMIVVIVLGLAVLIDVWDAQRRRATWYFLTTRRAIRMQDTLTGRVTDVALYRLTAISASEGGDRIGTVWCMPLDNREWPTKSRKGNPTPLFRMIVEPKRVRLLLLEAQRELLEPS